MQKSKWNLSDFLKSDSFFEFAFWLANAAVWLAAGMTIMHSANQRDFVKQCATEGRIEAHGVPLRCSVIQNELKGET